MSATERQARRLLPRRAPSAAGVGVGPLSRLSARLGYRTRTLGAALALALLAVLVTSSYVRGYERRVRAGVASVEVLVAARDIPAGTPGSKLAAHGFLARRHVPRDAVVPGAIAGVEEVGALVARQPIYAGEQISVRRFESATQQGLRGQLTGTMRAQRVPGDADQLLAGILRDGDRVDVVATLGATTGSAPRSRVVLRDILVVQAAVEDAVAKTGTKSTSVVLALTDRQAQRLFLVLKNGQWSLLLRPGGRAADSPGGADSVASVLGGTS